MTTNINKIINSRCVCTQGLPWIIDTVIMIDPCEHLIHKKCFDKCNTTKCPYCNEHILRIIHPFDFKYDKTLYQKCIDIISVSNFDNMTNYSPDEILLNIPNLLSTLIQIPFTKGHVNAKKLCKEVFEMNNIKIKVKGLKKIKDGPKVFIANHTSHLDFLSIFYVLGTSFLSSINITHNVISNQITKMVPLLLIDRGKKDASTVDQMKKYVEENGSICLFPEGMITHPDTIIRFRTGAFNVGYPIYPIVLKYKNVVGDMSTQKFILKISSKQEEIIEMHILDPFYPPFDENKIEMVRFAMANKGKLILSRVSNKDIVELKTKKK